MCVNCLSTAEVVAAQAAFAVYALEPPIRRRMAKLGLVAERDRIAHDVRTVAFLRNLDLDPVEILGRDVVDAAAAWTPQPAFERRRFRSAAPIGSHTRLALQ